MRQQDLLDRLGTLPAETRRRVSARLGETLAPTVEAPADAIEKLLATGGGGLGGALWDRLAAELASEPGGEEALVGEELGGQVRIDSVLGRGGMGAVYEGFDTWLERPVAVKTVRSDLLRDRESLVRFRREARLLSRLDHPHICRVYGLIRHAERDFLVLELIVGEPLSKAGPLDAAGRMRVARDIADALVAAHAQRIVHRDLKPGNVMVTPEGRAKVLDFGLSRAAEVGAEDEGGAIGEIAGTLAYMSPEQARGDELAPSSDLYAFGLILQELFSARPAHPRDLGASELLRRAQAGEKDPADDLAPETRSLVDRLTAKDPADRPDAPAAAAALAKIAEGPGRRRRRLGLVAIAAILLLALAATAFVSHRAARTPVALAEARRLMLAPVANATGDPALDWTEQGLAGLISQSLDDLVEVVPPDRWRGDGAAWPDRLEEVGADVGVEATLEPDGRGYILRCRIHRAGEAPIRRSLRGLEPTLLARELSRRLRGFLRPEAEPSPGGAGGPAQHFVREPFLDRLYAIGAERLRAEGAEQARPYFEVLRSEAPEFAPAAVTLAMIARQAGDVEGAEDAFQALLADPSLADRERFEALDQLLLIALERGDGRGAVEDLLSQLEALASRLEPVYVARHLEAAANAWSRLGEEELAWEAQRRGKRSYVELGRPKGQLTMLHIEAVLHSRDFDWDAMDGALEEAEQLSRAIGSRLELSKVLGNRSEALYRRGLNDEAWELSIEAQALFEEQGAETNARSMRTLRAILLGDTGRLEEAEAIYRTLLEEAAGLDYDLGVLYVNLSDVLIKAGRYDEAEEIVERVEGLETWAATSFQLEDRRIRLLYERGDFAGALRRMEALFERLPESVHEEVRPSLEAFRRAVRLGRRVPLPGEPEFEAQGPPT
ncbi:MAG: protein kinase [Acidobacteriota bacterium]